MERFDRTFSKVLNMLDKVAQIVLFALMMFFILYIVLRWFGINIMGTFEIAQYACLLVVIFAIPRNGYKGGNITITVFTDSLPKTARKIVIR